MILALSIDGLTAAFAYASNHVKMSWLNMAVIALIETLSLSCSMGAAGIVQDDLSIVFTKGISFVIFFCIGCSTLFQASLKNGSMRRKSGFCIAAMFRSYCIFMPMN